MAESSIKQESTSEKTKATTNNNFRVIGVGASAGGLEALKGFFENIPEDTEHCYVVVQHLSPNHKSLMADLLSKHTKIPISEVKRTTKVKPNNIYLIPPKKNIFFEKGSLRLKDRPTTKELNLPIDLFFKSMASELKEDAIVVILSGTGSDGTSGARDIKEGGGMVIVQDPNQAKFSSMPQNAINTRLVDYVLAVERMGQEIHRFINHPTIIGSLEDKITNNERTLIQILNFVNNHTNLDFESYKRPTLARMMARRIGVKHLNSLEEYKDYLFENPEEAQILVREFLVGVTSFYRDQAVWDILEQEIVPKMIASKGVNEAIKCWCVGVSSGEEAYSLAILINEALKRQGLKNNVKVFATDIEVNHLEDGSKGVYSESSMANISLKRLAENFTRQGDTYQVNENIRRMVIFSEHNILKDPPFIKMDITTCRNMLIYMQQAAQNRAIDVLHYSLNLGGIMVLGSSESISSHKHVLEELYRKEKIFKNIRKVKTIGLNSSQSNGNLSGAFGSNAPTNELKIHEKLTESINESLNIVTIIVDADFNIISAVGELSTYISLPNRGFSMNLLKMTPESFAAILRHLIRKCDRSNKKEYYHAAELVVKDKVYEIDLYVSEFQTQQNFDNKQYMLILQPLKTVSQPQNNIKLDAAAIDNLRVSQLEAELKDSRHNLRNMVEEVETTNEELQATNEELLASNEELQSTNEELQSVNEELYTVNAELQEKIEELNDSNADLDNLFNSTEIATLFLDKDLNIRKFTPNISEHFNFRAEDVGRPLTHFTNTFKEADRLKLVLDVKAVINEGKSKITELIDDKDKWYYQKIVPFYNYDKQIEGAIINYIDINPLKTAQIELEQKEAELRALFDHAPDMFVSVDIDGKIITCNNEVLKVLGYDKHEEVIGKYLSELHSGVDQEQLKKDHERVANGEVLRDMNYTITSKTGEKIPVRVNAKALYNKDGSIKTMLGSWRDVRQLIEMEDLVKDKNMAFEEVLESTMAGFWDWNIPAKTEYLSPTFKQMFGYRDSEMENSPEAWQNIAHPDDLPRVFEIFDAHVKTKGEVPFDNEMRYYHKNGSIVWVWCKGKVIEWDENDQPVRMVGSHVDITALKNLNQSNKELERFAYIASHDLQEPLRTISDFIGLFDDEYTEVLDDDGITYLNYIKDASHRMGTLIKGILSHSKIGVSKEMELVNLNSLVDDVLKDLYLIIKSKDAEINVKKLPDIKGGPIELHSLFLNLIKNALKFTRKDVTPKIEIGTIEDKDAVHLYVKDNGIGIDQKHYENIFEIFKKLHNQNEFEGTGIGLAHCKKIVHLHGGKIWIDSKKGEGSTFHFTLSKNPTINVE